MRLRVEERLHLCRSLRIVGKLLLHTLLLVASAQADGSREETHISEGSWVEHTDAERVVATHRQAADGRVVGPFLRLVVLLDVVHHVGETLFVRHFRPFLLLESRFQRAGIVRSIAVWHHHNHGFRLAQRNEIVQDLCRSAQSEPCLLVAACTVQQIKHRISLPLVVPRRRIDAHASLQPQLRTVVPDVRHIAVLHIVVLVEPALVALLLAHNERTHKGADVAAALDVARILRLHTIDIKAVTVEFRRQLGCRVRPNAVLLPEFAVAPLNAVAHNRHLLRLGSLDAEGYCAVVVELGRTRVVSLENGLLSLSRKGRKQHGCKESESFHAKTFKYLLSDYLFSTQI